MNMIFHPSDLSPTGLDPQLIELLLDEHRFDTLPRLEKFWDYYRNEQQPTSLDAATPGTARPYRLAQEQGLPPRLTRPTPAGEQREIVIENDIAWRIHALVDFMFAKPVSLQSTAPDTGRALILETFLRMVFEANGGMSFFHDLGLLGSIYGYVDVLVRVDENFLSKMSSPNFDASNPLTAADLEILQTIAHHITLEIIEAPRAVPVLNPDDYRGLNGYILHYRQYLNEVRQPSLLDRVMQNTSWRSSARTAPARAWIDCAQIWTNDHYLSFRAGPGENAKLVEESINRLGRIPIVHMQNLPQPYFYEGLSEVEPLTALQDELNIRLSDRANRVTFQSFKMYLGKGIEDFTSRPVGPGQMWATDNENATILEFGGDSASPSEDAHIQQIRDALDKASSVTPVSAGLLRDHVGNLTSENALRIVMAGLLTKTDRKRLTYGNGITRLCEMILHTVDVFGLIPNRPDERRVRLDWPNPLPDSQADLLRNAQTKIALGVPRKQVLAELGYSITEGAPANIS